jgi:hypothetical protein
MERGWISLAAPGAKMRVDVIIFQFGKRRFPGVGSLSNPDQMHICRFLYMLLARLRSRW